MYGFDEINDATGFANGNRFLNADEVRAYFTVEAQQRMFPGDEIDSQEVLDAMAFEVIENHWHMEGRSA